MSNILKGILNESNSVYGHSDPAREYGAEDPPRFNKSRSSYPSQEDDTFDADVEYSRKMYQLSQKQKRDADHDRLATGTNEGVRDLGYDAQSLIMKLRRDIEEKRLQPTRQSILAAARELAGDMNFAPELLVQQVLSKGVAEGMDDPWGDQGNFAGDKPVNLGGVSIKNIQTGDNVKYLGQPAKVVAMSKDRKQSRITISKGMGSVTQDVLTSDLKRTGLSEEQLDELSPQTLASYKKKAGIDATQADKEGDYKRGDKRFSGIVKATKKQFANDTKKSGISQGINEFAVVPTGPKGPKDYGQPNSSRYIGGNKFVVGTTNNYVLTATIDKWGLEWDEDDEIWFLDSPGAAHIADASEGEIELPPPREQRNQIHDLVTDYLNARNSADLQKVAAYYGHSDDGEMATNEEFRPTSGQANNIRKQTAQKMNPGSTKFVWKRPNQIGGSHTENELKSLNFKYSSKHNVWGGTQDMWNSLSSNLDENLGDQLKATSLDALVKAKLAIEQQREAEIEAWKRDFEKNTVQKAQQGLRREFQPTPVAQPGEKHSVLKARLSQLNSAIEKQALLDKLVDRLERKGLMTPAMQNDTDTRMHVRYGAKDNYESLNKKLDNAIKMLQDRLYIRKKSGLKEEEQLDELKCWSGYHRVAGTKAGFPGSCAKNKTNEEGVAEGWQEESQDLEDWSKEVNKRLYRAHESQRPALARQLSKLEQKNFGSSLNKGSLTELVHSALMAIQKGNMVHYDPQSVGSMPFGNIVGDDARVIANSGLKKYDVDGYRGLKRAGIVDTIEQFLHLRDLADNQGQAIMKYANMPPVAAWMQFIKDIGWSKDDMNEEVQAKTDDKLLAYYAQRKAEKEKQQQGVVKEQHSCPHCGGEMVSEELMNEKKDACYYKVKSRYKVWPSAYASGALVKCRKKGADSWGNGGKKNESSILEGIERADENLNKWFKEKWVRFGPDGKIRGDCARGDDSEGKPKCLPQSKAHSLGKKGRASAASRKRREDPNPERSGKAINVNTKKKANEGVAEGFSNDMSTEDMIAYLRQHHDKNLHPDYLNHLTNTNSKFVLKNIPLTSIRTELSGLDRAKVEQYKKMDFSKAPPIVVGSDGNILDGYHRANVAKALGISTVKAYVGIKGQQGMAEDQLDEKWSQKYKDSINCSNPKGFSQKAHCQGKKK